MILSLFSGEMLLPQTDRHTDILYYGHKYIIHEEQKKVGE